MDGLFWLALLSGGFMAWAVGANDVANAMGTSVGSKTLTIRQAIIIAAIFESLGALLGSSAVTNTIRNDIVDITFYQSDSMTLVAGMIAALLASGSWLVLATVMSWPVSTTHSIVGAIVGFGMVTQGASGIKWLEVFHIGLSWVFTPVCSGLLSWCCFKAIQKLIFSQRRPIEQAIKILPTFIFFSSLLLLYLIIKHGIGASMPHYITMPAAMLLASAAALVLAGVVYTWLGRIESLHNGSYREVYANIERVFGALAVFSACILAFSHGANDVANAIGPMVAVVDILHYGYLPGSVEIPFWVFIWGASGVVLGLSMYGYRIMVSVGTRITHLSPSRSFSAQLATSMVILVATSLGYPVSTTQTLVGAVLGVGFARGFAAVDLGVVRGIFMSWCVTVPAGAVFSVLFFYILRVFI